MKYSIQGDTLPVVICELDAGEKIITEGGGMAWMSPNMKMRSGPCMVTDNAYFQYGWSSYPIPSNY